MRIRSFLSIGLCLLLAGCTTFENLQRDKLFSDREKGRDVCGMKYLNSFIGTSIDDISIRDHLPEKYSFRAFDPRPFLAGGLDQIITTDLRPNRQNIDVDENGLIFSLECY